MSRTGNREIENVTKEKKRQKGSRKGNREVEKVAKERVMSRFIQHPTLFL